MNEKEIIRIVVENHTGEVLDVKLNETQDELDVGVDADKDGIASRSYSIKYNITDGEYIFDETYYVYANQSSDLNPDIDYPTLDEIVKKAIERIGGK